MAGDSLSQILVLSMRSPMSLRHYTLLKRNSLRDVVLLTVNIAQLASYCWIYRPTRTASKVLTHVLHLKYLHSSDPTVCGHFAILMILNMLALWMFAS